MLLGMAMTVTNGFAQTSTVTQEKQPVSSDQVLTRVSKKDAPSDRPVTSGCMELTRVRPAVKRTAAVIPPGEIPVAVDRIKKD